MDLFFALEKVIDFFVDPFLTVLMDIGIENMEIKMAFGSVEWFSIQLFDLVSLVGSYIILFIFFRIIYKILKTFVRIVTGGIKL